MALDTPGLFFLGQDFMYAAASATLPGVCRDARYLAGKIPVPVSRGAAASASRTGASSGHLKRRETAAPAASERIP